MAYALGEHFEFTLERLLVLNKFKKRSLFEYGLAIVNGVYDKLMAFNEAMEN